MPTYRVTCTGQVTEHYLVDAESEEEAQNNWCDGELIHSEAWDVLPESVRLEEDYERGGFITAIENCTPTNLPDYYRWQGHVAARRQLLERLEAQPMSALRYEFSDEEQLKERLAHLNYDLGKDPEFACIDANNRVFIAALAGTGDSIGFAYYVTGPEGYMYHYGVGYDGYNVNLEDWVPTFPVSALGEPNEQDAK